MNLGKYLQQLLLENETVIIPGFGAFISNYKPAEIDEETNEMKPPSKEISFNQQIRNNDGLLVGCVAQGEVVSHFDALKQIEKERENLLYELDKHGKAFLEEIGDLFFNENHEIYLIPVKHKNLLLDSFGLESVSLESATKKEDIEIKEAISTKEVETSANPDEHISISDKGQEFDAQKIKTEKEPEPVEQQYDLKEKPEKKKRGWMWLLLVLAPLVVVTFFIINRNNGLLKSAEKENEKPATRQDEQVLLPDTTETESVPQLDNDSSELAHSTDTVPAVQPKPDQARYILVGGSFKEKENAETYLNQLNAKGFESFHLGKRGSYFIVGIGRYSTESEAVSAKRKFNNENPNSGVWVLEEN